MHTLFLFFFFPFETFVFHSLDSKFLFPYFWWWWWRFVGAIITEEDAGLELHVAMRSTFAVIVIMRQRYLLFSPFCVSPQKSCLFVFIWCGSVLFFSLEHAEQPFGSARTHSPWCSTSKDNYLKNKIFGCSSLAPDSVVLLSEFKFQFDK